MSKDVDDFLRAVAAAPRAACAAITRAYLDARYPVPPRADSVVTVVVEKGEPANVVPFPRCHDPARPDLPGFLPGLSEGEEETPKKE